ncbi:MAG: hypothetical protein ABIP53_02765 [Candidatus Limnocylindrales bacterium]
MSAKRIGAFDSLQLFLDRLDAKRVTYRLGRDRDSSVKVEVHLPRVHWEIEFFANGEIELERYAATEEIQVATDTDGVLALLGPLD